MAELTGCEGVLALLKQIYEVLQEYDQQTDAMINAELEVLQQSLLARNALIEKLEELKQQLESVIEVEQPEERVLLQTLVHGSYVNAPLDDQHKEIQLMKQRIVDKDKVISGQFKNQHVDSRRELEQLKQTRQKIGYYNSAVVNRATGQSLNKNL